MVDSNLLQGVGLDCVLNCKGQVILRGRIKRSPEDFIVNEIDTQGNRVTLHSTNIIPSLPTMTTDTNEITNEAEGNEVTTPTQLDTHPSPIEIPPLSSLISSDSFLQVERLAIMWEEHVGIGGPLSDERVNIGCYDDKHVRTSVHLGFRKEFPSLKSNTEKTVEGVSEIIVVPDRAYLSLVPLLGSEESKKILQFVNITTRSPESVHYLPPDDSRAHRTEVHRVIDKLFGHLVETKSFVKSPRPPSRKKRKVVDEDNELCPTNVGGALEEVGVAGSRTHGTQICVRFRKKAYRMEEKGGKQSQSGGGQNWYLKFVLKKENMETPRAVHKLSELLSCHPSQFSYAGLKDKNAITTQLMTLKNVTADRLSSVSYPLLQCGNCEYVSQPLRLGQLCGNHFQLRVTHLSSNGDTSDELIETTVKERISALQADGFINYYGPQRFGLPKAAVLNETESRPVQIGLAMLKEDCTKAVNLILQPDNNDWDGPINKAKRYYTSTGDINGTLSRLPDNRNTEISVLKTLKRHGISEYGCHRALLNIPYQMRQLYIHSFSSLIWNHLASFRINWYGNQPVKGDLVISDKQHDSKKVRPLTQADIESGIYTVHDIVLPLPGTDIATPENKVGQKLSELLSSVDITMASFAVSRKFCFAVPGAYRSVLSRPHNLSWESNNKVPRDVSVESTGHNSCLSLTNQYSYQDIHHSSSSLQSLTDHVAAPGASLKLCFDLDSSCYATSMLREILNERITY